jgi:methionyl-tRNA formyltransferase
VSYAHKVDKAEALLNWQLPASVLERRVRAFDPFPGCQARFRLAHAAQGSDPALELKVWRARTVAAQGQPGDCLEAGPDRLLVACGHGALELLDVQPAGGKRMPAAEFLRRLQNYGPRTGQFRSSEP